MWRCNPELKLYSFRASASLYFNAESLGVSLIHSCRWNSIAIRMLMAIGSSWFNMVVEEMVGNVRFELTISEETDFTDPRNTPALPITQNNTASTSHPLTQSAL